MNENTNTNNEDQVNAQWVVCWIDRISNYTNDNIWIYSIEKNLAYVIKPKEVKNISGMPLAWVASDHEFITITVLMEIGNKIRYYLFDYNEHIRCVESKKYIQSPLLKDMQVKMDGTEWRVGTLIKGTHKKNAFKSRHEIAIYKKINDNYEIKSRRL